MISREGRAWINSHPKEWRGALDKWGMVSGGDWRNPDLGHVEWSGKTPWKSQGTQVASAPKLGSQAYWEQGRTKAGEPQVAAKTPERADPTPRPRSEPPAQVASAGPKVGTQEYWRGPKHVIAFATLLSSALAADNQSFRTAGMQSVRAAAEGEVLAVGCGLRLNEAKRDALRSEARSMLDTQAFESMDQFARTYTLSLLKRHRRAVCARALNQFGPQGEQVKDLLSP